MKISPYGKIFKKKFGNAADLKRQFEPPQKSGKPRFIEGVFRSVVENPFSPIEQHPRGRVGSARFLYRQEWGTISCGIGRALHVGNRRRARPPNRELRLLQLVPPTHMPASCAQLVRSDR